MTEFLNIALPKGRLGEQVYARFAEAGYPCPDLLEDNRRLIFENPDLGLRYFWVKPQDVATYVERGAADIGVAGSDLILETEPDVYELLDLELGLCRLCTAGPAEFSDSQERILRIATKYPRLTARYFAEQNRRTELIKLNGSIELAPILGLSDLIVDIVETGRTLVENGLAVRETILEISARLIANKAAFRFKQASIRPLAEALIARSLKAKSESKKEK